MIVLRVNVANALAHREKAEDLADHFPQDFVYLRSALRMSVLSFEKIISKVLKSAEYGNRNKNNAPRSRRTCSV